MSEERRKLNLKNVVDLIGEEYSEWSDGDFVIIETQTGTGKTYFIEQQLIRYLSFSKVLFLCNRINLVRQIKKDLLAMYNMEIPSSVHKLDNKMCIRDRTYPMKIHVSNATIGIKTELLIKSKISRIVFPSHWIWLHIPNPKEDGRARRRIIANVIKQDFFREI